MNTVAEQPGPELVTVMFSYHASVLAKATGCCAASGCHLVHSEEGGWCELQQSPLQSIFFTTFSVRPEQALLLQQSAAR